MQQVAMLVVLPATGPVATTDSGKREENSRNQVSVNNQHKNKEVQW